MRQPGDRGHVPGAGLPARAGTLAVLTAVGALGCGSADGEPAPRGAVATTAAQAPASARRPAATTATTAVGRATQAGAVRAVHIVSRVGTTGAADASPKRAKVADGVTLYALLEVEDGGRTRWYSDAGAVRWRGKALTPAPLADGPAVTLHWRRIEPTTASMSNTGSGQFRFEPVPYQATAIAATGGAIAADVRPTLTPDHGDGVGTMRYQLVVDQGATERATPGIEAVRGRGSGGLTDEVHRVSLRTDDSFLGMLEEMYGQPYIWASAGSTDRSHQSERLEGSDCADLMVYGARRVGLDVPYGYTGSLGRHARTLAKGALAADGVYRDRDGKPLPFTAKGDMILFPRHVGALAEDRGVPGVLDQDDVMIHTLFDSPKRQPIADSGYADNPVELLRWRAGRR